MSARIQRDTADQAIEITTESFFDSIKSGLKKTFSDENVNVSWDSHVLIWAELIGNDFRKQRIA